MRLGSNSKTYIGLKHRLAEKVRKVAHKNGFPVRALLGCISTRNDRIQFTHAAGQHLNVKDIGKLEERASDVSVKDVAQCVLLNKNVTSVLLHDLPTEKLAIDFSSPNIAKPFHVGHLTSTVLGNYIANLKQYLGDEVVRINYLGDWGTQFGILSAGFQRFGSDERLRKDPLKHLVDVYVQGNKLLADDDAFKQKALDEFAKLEADDKRVKEFWWNIRDTSLKEHFKIYAKLGIKFDLIQGESAYHKDAIELVDCLASKKILVEKDGVKGINVREDSFVTLMKSNGSTLYLTRDICAALSRKKKFNVDCIYYVVDNSQTKHFEDLRHCLKVLPKSDVKIVHVKFGRIRGLSTRKGQVVLLQELLDEATRRAQTGLESIATTRVTKDEVEKTAFELGLAALYVNTLKTRRQRDSTFDWESCLALKGDSGISLQYANARLCSLIETNKNVEARFHDDVLPTFLDDENVREAIVQLAQFDECLLRSDATLESSELVQYLFRLRHIINKAFMTARIKGADPKLAETRMLLYVKLQEALHEGLRLLGIRPLKKM